MRKGKKLLLFLLLFISQLIILAIINACGQLVYATNDDTTMVSLACGAYGEPSEYIVNMHILLGYLLKFLFINIAGINWVTILFICTYLLAFIVIDYVLLREMEPLCVNLAKAIIVDIMFVLCIDYFSFTVVAYAAVIAGMVGLLFTSEEWTTIERYCVKAVSFFALIIGLMIRGEAAKSLLLIVFPIAVFEIIYKRKIKTLAIMAMVFILMTLSIESNTYIVNMNPAQKEFYSWGETRSAALDCQAVPYDEEIFDAVGISEPQYKAIYYAFYYAYETVDTDVMREIIKLNDVQNKYNFDIMGFLEEHFLYLGNVKSFDYIYATLFYALLVFFFVLGDKCQKMLLVFIWIMTLGAHFVFFFINRALYRVVMPNYVLAMLIILCVCRIEKKYIDFFEEREIDIKRIFMLVNAIFIIFAVNSRINHYGRYQDWLYGDERKMVIEYLEDNSEKIFMAGDPSVFSIGTVETVWNSVGATAGWNIIGNWEIYSVPHLQLMEKHNIEDPYNVLKLAIDNENIMLLTTYGDGFYEYSEWIVELIDECYGVRAQVEKVDTICRYNVYNIYDEEWAVFKLVSEQE